jgi:hypothetical protein
VSSVVGVFVMKRRGRRKKKRLQGASQWNKYNISFYTAAIFFLSAAVNADLAQPELRALS